jgi:hypothetical protein
VRGVTITASRPPWHRWLLYRLYEVRLPYRYRWWAREDALGRWYPLRVRLSNLARGVIFMVLARLVLLTAAAAAGDTPPSLPSRPADWAVLVVVLVVFLIPIPPLERWLRRRVLRKHEFLDDGTPYEAVSAAFVGGGGQAGPDRR